MSLQISFARSRSGRLISFATHEARFPSRCDTHVSYRKCVTLLRQLLQRIAVRPATTSRLHPLHGNVLTKRIISCIAMPSCRRHRELCEPEGGIAHAVLAVSLFLISKSRSLPGPNRWEASCLPRLGASNCFEVFTAIRYFARSLQFRLFGIAENAFEMHF